MARLRGLQQIFQSQDASDPLLRVSGGVTTLSFLSSSIDFEKDGVGSLLQVVDPNQLLFTLNGGLSYIIGTDSADGSDNRSLALSANNATSPTRGAFIRVAGNEHSSSAGDVDIEAGDVTGGNVTIKTHNASSNIYLYTANTARWGVGGTGHLTPLLDNAYNIGSPSFRVGTLYADTINVTSGVAGIDEIVYTGIANTYKIYADTADAADNKTIQLCGGGDFLSSRGGALAAYGNEHATKAGQVEFITGSVASSHALLTFGNATSEFRIQNTSALPVVSVNNSGEIVFGVNGLIRQDTAAAADTRNTVIAGGGLGTIARGGIIRVYGINATSNQGVIDILSGNDANANINITTGNTSASVRFTYGNNGRVSFTQAASRGWYFSGNNGEFYFIGSGGSGHIGTDTSDGTDNRTLALTGAGGGASSTATFANAHPRGAAIWIAGNENPGGAAGAGAVALQGGNVVSGHIMFRTTNASASIQFLPSGTLAWSINNSGQIVQATTGGNIVFNTSQGKVVQTTNLQEIHIGDSTLGSSLQLLPNGTSPIALLASGSSSGGSVRLSGTHSAAPVIIQPGGGVTRWTFGATGQLVQDATNGSDLVFNTAAPSIRQGTSDGADNKRLELSGGGAIGSSRGAYISLFGNEEANTGRVDITAGNVAGGNINLSTGGALRWQITDTAGHLVGTPVSNAKQIRLSDQASELYLCGGDGNNASANGAIIQLNGYTHATQAGALFITGSNLATSLVKIASNHVSADIELSANNPTGTRKLVLSGNDGSLTTTTPTSVDFVLKQSTVDGADNKGIVLAGGGSNAASRGAQLSLFGNEHTGTGGVNIQTGDALGGNLFLIVNNGTGQISHRFNGVNRWLWNDAGETIFNATTTTIRADTSDGADNKAIEICGGGATGSGRGARITIAGNEYSDPGKLYLNSGLLTESTAFVQINSNGNSHSRFTGNGSNTSNILLLNTTNTILTSTSDAADNASITVAGGGLADTSRGSFISVFGNEHASAGTIQLRLGNNSNARLQAFLQSGTALQIINAAAADVFRIEEYGRVSHKAHANYSGSGHFKYTDAVNTTDATVTTIFQLGDISAGVADNTTYTFTVDIVGRFNSTTAKGIGGKLKFVVYRNNGGAAVLAADFGGRIREKETYGSSGYDFDVDVSGNDVRIRVTGATGETVSWVMNAEWIAVSTA